jgi:hypothetical protein
MPYKDPEVRRAKARARRAEERAVWKAVAPFSNIAQGPARRYARAEQQLRGVLKAAKAGGPKPVTLPPINAPTLTEIERKYGRIE